MMKFFERLPIRREVSVVVTVVLVINVTRLVALEWVHYHGINEEMLTSRVNEYWIKAQSVGMVVGFIYLWWRLIVELRRQSAPLPPVTVTKDAAPKW